MAKGTVYKFAGVAIDYCKFDLPIYRGTNARPVEVKLSLAKFDQLKAAIKSRKGVIDFEVTCSAKRGLDAPEETKRIAGLRVVRFRKESDFTCTLTLADSRLELSKWVAVSNVNLKFRDGYVDGTEASTLEQALKKVLRPGAMSLFSSGAFKGAASDKKVPDRLLFAGGLKTRGIDHLLSLFGVDLWCRPEDGKLEFASRSDIGAVPTKASHSWIRGGEPAWISSDPGTYRLPRKMLFYYRRRHMMIVPIVRDTDTSSSTQLTVVGQQIYQIDDHTDKKTYLSQVELFAKFGVQYMTDVQIGKAVMSDNFEGTPMERDGSRDRDQLIRIVKRDWGKLYRMIYPHRDGAWGGWTEMQIGVLRRDGTKWTDDLIAAGVRGDWVEFLSVVNGAGPNSILGQKIFTNHDEPIAGVTTLLPTMPFSGTWENEDDGVVRLTQQPMPDDNFAMPGLVGNQQDMTIKATFDPVSYGGQLLGSRWRFDVPSSDKAEIVPGDKYLIVVATQRWPNDERQFKVHTIDGFADGDVDFQEYEVTDLPALYDFVDDAAPGRFDFQRHDRAADGLGAQLNEADTLLDAQVRAEVQKEELLRKHGGPGTAAGLSGLAEGIHGSVDEVVVRVDGPVILSTIRCDNLDTVESRERRARMRATTRSIKQAKNEVQAV